MTMRDKAAALARGGFRVFKLGVDDRTPLSEGFFDRASSDPKRVEDMWTSFDGSPEENNIGILTGDGIFVIDVDVKNGKAGAASLKALKARGLETKTLTAVTPSGGMHLFYRHPAGAPPRNSVEALAPGIDVRGYHGYVAAPGSSIGDKSWRWHNEGAEILDAPEWLLDDCGKHIEKGEKVEAVVDLDADAAIARAAEWLRDSAPVAVANAGGNATTYQVACRVMDFGVSELAAVDVMSEWNVFKAEPPWSHSDLALIVHNAAAYRTSPIGIKSPAADFEPVPGQGEVGTREGRLYFRRFHEMADRALTVSPNPLIKKFLDCGDTSVLYGASNTGKTFVALSLAYHIATGAPFMGRKTVAGGVAYVAAEASESISSRIAALRDHFKPGVEPPLATIPCSVDLFDPRADLKPLMALIEAVGGVRFVVVDTLARALAGGDENSAKDMGAFIANVDVIRARTGAAVMIVHHSGKDASKGARGSSALRAAVDTELEIAGGAIHVRKQRSYPSGYKIGFSLPVIVLGQDEDGDDITSCVATFSEAEEDFQAENVTSAQAQWFAVIRAWENKQGVAMPRGHDGPAFTWQTLSDFNRVANLTPPVVRQVLLRHIEGLHEAGLLKRVNKSEWCTAPIEIIE